MLLSGHQPVYLPGIILLNKISLSDAFMFVGHVQYSRKSWQTRNCIRSGDTSFYLSVPVKKAGRFGDSICETIIDGDKWKRKHIGAIRQAYAKRPFFEDYFPDLESLLMKEYDSLGSINMAIIQKLLEWFSIDTPVYDSRDYNVSGNKTEMLISMCREMGADSYLSNLGSLVYVDEDLMAKSGVSHLWQQFKPPVYEQGSPFIENLSAIDLLFNVGPDGRDLIISAGTVATRNELPDELLPEHNLQVEGGS